ncbi:MAG: MBL fold metallo-hydrolase [Rhodospirillaceae bacterium]|nr:MBL fold metallo-hydrolase [Rhodospirillaceae bacterium]
MSAVLFTAPAMAQDAKAVIAKAQAAMGNPATLQYAGTGMNAFFGQALTAGQEWPRRPLESMTAAVNYDQKAATLGLVFKNPVFGGQRQNTFVNGDRAWNIGPNGPSPQLAAAEERQLQIWMTPHGFLRAAAASNATATSRTEGGAKVDVVSFIAMNKFKLTGTIDAAGMVTGVETQFPNPVMGDMAYAYKYSDYKDFGGVRFPAHIVQSGGGFAVNDFTVTGVQTTVTADLAVPPNIRSATAPAVQVATTKLADGVWLLAGGSHHSVVVDFDKYLAVVEAPQTEDRSLAVIAEARKLVPGKSIKYVISTHHHFDHSGGLRTYVAEGATVVTHISNEPYFEKTFAAPATIVPDAQSKAHKTPVFETVNDKRVISDGKRSVEVYNTIGDSHSNELSVVYIPAAKILIEADSYSPGTPASDPVPSDALVLYDNIQRLKLDVATVVGIHGRGAVPMAEFAAFAGKK